MELNFKQDPEAVLGQFGTWPIWHWTIWYQESKSGQFGTKNANRQDKEMENLIPENLAPGQFGPGQFGTGQFGTNSN